MTTGGKNIENVDRGRETKYVSGLVMMRRGRTNFFSWIRVDVSFCSWCCAVIYNKRFKKFKKKTFAFVCYGYTVHIIGYKQPVRLGQ